MHLILFGGNAKLAQCVLQIVGVMGGVSKITVYSKNPYKGVVLSKMNVVQIHDACSLQQNLEVNIASDTECYIIYLSSFNRRGAFPAGLEKLDPDFSFFLQRLASFNNKVRRLVIAGSTQAILLTRGGDVYLKNKKKEYQYFISNHRRHSNNVTCYVALPPLDSSTHPIGRFFVRSRGECAHVLVRALFSLNKMVVPTGIFLFISKITAFGIEKETF